MLTQLRSRRRTPLYPQPTLSPSALVGLGVVPCILGAAGIGLPTLPSASPGAG
jgi:hypothetical protein